MFRFNEPTKEWKERGTGDVRSEMEKNTDNLCCGPDLLAS
jgi:hypothetical protein